MKNVSISYLLKNHKILIEDNFSAKLILKYY